MAANEGLEFALELVAVAGGAEPEEPADFDAVVVDEVGELPSLASSRVCFCSTCLGVDDHPASYGDWGGLLADGSVVVLVVVGYAVVAGALAAELLTLPVVADLVNVDPVCAAAAPVDAADVVELLAGGGGTLTALVVFADRGLAPSMVIRGGAGI